MKKSTFTMEDPTQTNDCILFSTFANLQRDTMGLVTAENLIDFAHKLEQMFMKRFGASFIKIYYTKTSFNYFFDPFHGNIVMKKYLDLRQSEKRYVFELGDRTYSMLSIVEFPTIPTNIMDAIIHEVIPSLSSVFVRLTDYFKMKGKDLFVLIDKLYSASTILDLSDALMKIQTMFDCDSVSPLLVSGGKIYHLTFAKIAPYLAKIWEEYKLILDNGDDVFQHYTIVTTIRDTTGKPIFLFIATKKETDEPFDLTSYQIQKALTPIIKDTAARVYKKNMFNEIETQDPNVEAIMEEQAETLLSLDAFVAKVGNHPMEALLCHIAQQLDLYSLCRLSTRQVNIFIATVKSKYRKNPYHNWSHAVDVTRNTFTLLKSTGHLQDFDGIERLAMFSACLCHDVDHRGVSNKQLEDQHHPLGILFKNLGVLEMHQATDMISILEPGPDRETLISHLSKEEITKFWQISISMVIATDMSRHKQKIAEFEELTKVQPLNYQDPNTRAKVLEFLIKCGDLSNLIEGMNASIEWAKLVAIENAYAAGNRDFVPQLNKVAKDELFFMDFFVKPLYSLCPLFSEGLKQYVDALNNNYVAWSKLVE